MLLVGAALFVHYEQHPFNAYEAEVAFPANAEMTSAERMEAAPFAADPVSGKVSNVARACGWRRCFPHVDRIDLAHGFEWLVVGWRLCGGDFKFGQYLGGIESDDSVINISS